jgi:hypothetical protein
VPRCRTRPTPAGSACRPPPGSHRSNRDAGALDVVLRAFTVARSVANSATLAPLLADPRVRVAPHVADAWATGLLRDVPTGPRDFRRTGDLVDAGRRATAQWLDAGVPAG